MLLFLDQPDRIRPVIHEGCSITVLLLDLTGATAPITSGDADWLSVFLGAKRDIVERYGMPYDRSLLGYYKPAMWVNVWIFFGFYVRRSGSCVETIWV